MPTLIICLLWTAGVCVITHKYFKHTQPQKVHFHAPKN